MAVQTPYSRIHRPCKPHNPSSLRLSCCDFNRQWVSQITDSCHEWCQNQILRQFLHLNAWADIEKDNWLWQVLWPYKHHIVEFTAPTNHITPRHTYFLALTLIVSESVKSWSSAMIDVKIRFSLKFSIQMHRLILEKKGLWQVLWPYKYHIADFTTPTNHITPRHIEFLALTLIVS